MIVYDPLWETLRKKGLSTYTLRVKFQISGSTVQQNGAAPGWCRAF